METVVAKRGRFLEMQTPKAYRLTKLSEIVVVVVVTDRSNTHNALSIFIKNDTEPWQVEFPSIDEALAAARMIRDYINEEDLCLLDRLKKFLTR